MVTVTGMNRCPKDVVGELMDVLADDPGVVECDLTGMAAEGSAMPDEFALVGIYLTRWPGTVVMVNAPDPTVRSRLCSAEVADRMFIHASWHAARTEAHRLLPALQRTKIELPPVPSAPQEARAFTCWVLSDWGLAQPVGPVSEVVSVLVMQALTRTPLALELMLSRVDEQIRVAVRDRDPGAAAELSVESPDRWLSGRGLRLLHAVADGWGMIPARSGGKTLWAVLNVANAQTPALGDVDGDEPSGRHRGPPDRDVLAELHGGPRVGRHRRAAARVPSAPGAFETRRPRADR